MALLSSTRKSQELAAQVDLGVLGGLLSFYIRAFDVAVTRHLDVRLGSLGFNGRKGTISALLLITCHPGIRATTISARLDTDKSIIVKIVDDLVGRGLVTRRSSAEDRRAMDLYPTEKAEALTPEIERLIVAHSDDFFTEIMTREEHDTVVDILRRAFCKLRGAR